MNDVSDRHQTTDAAAVEGARDRRDGADELTFKATIPGG